MFIRLVMFAAVRTAGILDSEIQQKFCIQQLMLIIGYCPVSKGKILILHVERIFIFKILLEGQCRRNVDSLTRKYILFTSL